VNRIGDEVFVRPRRKAFVPTDETILAIRNCLTSTAADPGVRTVYVDMDEVEYLSDAFLFMLVQVHKKLKSRNSRLRLRNLPPQSYEVFHWYFMKLDEEPDIE
jgi:anti-anti-sigma regulatory factor